jgi:long-chain acyl-CoA synthetase
MEEPRYRNLVDVLEDGRRRFAGRPALGHARAGQWRWTSYTQLAWTVDRCRAGLAALGVGPGDRVAFVGDNRVEWAVAAFATYGREAIFVPMYGDQLPKEWKHILADSRARVAITAGGELTDIVRELGEGIPTLQHVIELDRPAEDPRGFAHLLEIGERSPSPPRSPAPEAVAGFIYTSGTTGLPKGVMLTHGNIVSNLTAIRDLFPVGPGDRSLAFLPWAHAFGQTCELHFLLSRGASVAINDTIPSLLENLAEVRPTVLVAVPRIFNRLYDAVMRQILEKPSPIRAVFAQGLEAAARHRAGERDTWLHELALRLDDRLVFSKVRAQLGGRLRFVISGSAALSREVAELIDALGVPVYEGYGLTETSPVVTANTPAHRRLGSVGRPIPGVRVAIDREVTGDPKEGEVVVHGPGVMKGYHGLPEATAKVLTEDGGLRTGDLGYLDPQGFLYITGRIKDAYKLETGKFVMPEPLEKQLELSPFISTIMLYGDNHPYNVALVVPDVAAFERWAERHGVELGDLTETPEVHEVLQREIERHATGAHNYELPKRLLVVDEDFTPDNGLLTPTMKVRRRNVLQRYGIELEALYVEDEERPRV